MKVLDAGARESLNDVVTKVLKRLTSTSQFEGKEEDLDDTLLNWWGTRGIFSRLRSDDVEDILPSETASHQMMKILMYVWDTCLKMLQRIIWKSEMVIILNLVKICNILSFYLFKNRLVGWCSGLRLTFETTEKNKRGFPSKPRWVICEFMESWPW